MKESEEKAKKKRKKKAVEGEGEKVHKTPWQEKYATVDDIKDFLGGRLYLRYNVITGRVECRLPSNYETDGTDWQPVSDRIVNSLWAELSKDKSTRAQDIYRVIESDFAPEYHPFKYYLDHLPPWDGKEDHILGLSLSVNVKGDADEQLLFAEYLKKWLVGMVAGWIDDDAVNNVVLVLLGEQGSYKTTWLKCLMPPDLKDYGYLKADASRMGRDDLLKLAQYGLVCCEELDTMRPSELNQLKAAITMPSIDERAAYAHFHEHRKHIASFCGTGNNVQFLSDPTGNRRWLPFEVENIDSPQKHPFNYEGIYSQAYALYQQGFRYWFSREEILRLGRHNQQFETPRLEYELASLYFRQPRDAEPGVFMSVARAMQVVSANISQKLSAVYLGRAMGELGFRRVKHNGVRGYIVVCRSGDEMHAAQQSMAIQATREEGSVDSSGQCF
jgi:predicted P-loop ATPase